MHTSSRAARFLAFQHVTEGTDPTEAATEIGHLSLRYCRLPEDTPWKSGDRYTQRQCMTRYVLQTHGFRETTFTSIGVRRRVGDSNAKGEGMARWLETDRQTEKERVRQRHRYV